MNKNDAQLVSHYLKGDEKSLEILIKNYLRPIYAFAYRYVSNFQDAEDITQEIFIKVWRNLKKFDKDKSFKTWIFSIAKNACIDFLRKKKTIPLAELENEIGKNDKFIELMDMVQLLQSASEKLLPKYQTVLSLRYNDNLNFREIAEKLKEQLHTVKSRHRRALAMLKNLL